MVVATFVWRRAFPHDAPSTRPWLHVAAALCLYHGWLKFTAPHSGLGLVPDTWLGMAGMVGLLFLGLLLQRWVYVVVGGLALCAALGERVLAWVDDPFWFTLGCLTAGAILVVGATRLERQALLQRLHQRLALPDALRHN